VFSVACALAGCCRGSVWYSGIHLGFLPNRPEIRKYRRLVLLEDRLIAAVRRLDHLLRLRSLFAALESRS
jgi:hypothetical protein